MQTTHQEILAKITPRSLFQILELYVQAWTKGIPTPLISFGLANGQELMGELIHADFPTERLVIRQVGDMQALHATFLDFRQIQYFTLYGLEGCKEFWDI